METIAQLWKRQRAERKISRELRNLATEEPVADLWTRIASDIGTVAEPAPRPRPNRLRLAAALAGCLLIGAAGTVAAKQGLLGWHAPVERRVGPFALTGFFFGRIECYDAAGNLIDVQDTTEAPATRTGAFDVRPAEPGMQIESVGGRDATYTLRGADGKPAGTLVLRRQREEYPENPYASLKGTADDLERAWSWQTGLWRSGTVGSFESPVGVSGYDCRSGLVWSVRGAVRVTVQPLDGKSQPQTLESSPPAEPLGAAIRSWERTHPEPEFQAAFQGKTVRRVGVGAFRLQDARGADALAVTVERATRQ